MQTYIFFFFFFFTAIVSGCSSSHKVQSETHSLNPSEDRTSVNKDMGEYTKPLQFDHLTCWKKIKPQKHFGFKTMRFFLGGPYQDNIGNNPETFSYYFSIDMLNEHLEPPLFRAVQSYESSWPIAKKAAGFGHRFFSNGSRFNIINDRLLEGKIEFKISRLDKENIRLEYYESINRETKSTTLRTTFKHRPSKAFHIEKFEQDFKIKNCFYRDLDY